MKCPSNLSFEECELAILRHNIDKIERIEGGAFVEDETVKEIIMIVENFLRERKLICYGGTAINNLLPEEDQFYNRDITFPDYDFFSKNALRDAKDLADIYFKKGFTDVEAKAGVHHGTYKVFVNYIPVADITQLDKRLFDALMKHAIDVQGIYYAPINYLRMAMYLELSRPKGDVGRWEKVLKRLILLNKNYPLDSKVCKEYKFEQKNITGDAKEDRKLFYLLRNIFIEQKLIFFGSYAGSLYSKYMPKTQAYRSDIPDFDVLSETPDVTIRILKRRLKDSGFKDVEVKKHDKIGEIIAPHYELIVDGNSVAFIYEPLACHSYNIVKIGNRSIRVASIDTILSFYLAFIYANREYYDVKRLICMSEFLFKIQKKNRLSQKGLLRRFNIECYGEQDTLRSMRSEKSKKYKELRNKKRSKEFEEWFLRYVPAEIEERKKQNKKTNKKNANKNTKKNAKKTQRKRTSSNKKTQKRR